MTSVNQRAPRFSLVSLVGLCSVVFGVSSIGLAYRLHEIDAAQSKPGLRATAH